MFARCRSIRSSFCQNIYALTVEEVLSPSFLQPRVQTKARYRDNPIQSCLEQGKHAVCPLYHAVDNKRTKGEPWQTVASATGRCSYGASVYSSSFPGEVKVLAPRWAYVELGSAHADPNYNNQERMRRTYRVCDTLSGMALAVEIPMPNDHTRLLGQTLVSMHSP
eukprot:scaffold25_cov342-Pavlova_lutheri.AAC.64